MYNKYFVGLKHANVPMVDDINMKLSSQPDYVIMGSFSFYLPKVLWRRLKNLNCPKLVIIPFDVIGSNGNPNRIINDISKIESLIKAGVAVIIDSNNHAKYILTENLVYHGSANLTSAGLVRNTENMEIMTSKTVDYKNWELSIKNYVSFLLEDYLSVIPQKSNLIIPNGKPASISRYITYLNLTSAELKDIVNTSQRILYQGTIAKKELIKYVQCVNEILNFIDEELYDAYSAELFYEETNQYDPFFDLDESWTIVKSKLIDLNTILDKVLEEFVQDNTCITNNKLIAKNIDNIKKVIEFL